MYLSKSDFKIAQDCPAKLYYKKKNYPRSNVNNEFLQLLAEGGFMVGKLAQMHFSNGIDLSLLSTEEAIEETSRLLSSNTEVTIFEAALAADNKLARVDILQKQGDEIKILEVKSKSFDSSDLSRIFHKNGKIKNEWKPYFEDVAFQYHVALKQDLGCAIKCYLFLPDKNKHTKIEGLNQLFKLEIKEQHTTERTVYQVEFTGDDPTVAVKSSILSELDITEQCHNMLPSIEKATGIYIQSLMPRLQKIKGNIGINCKMCEYNIEAPNSGFSECWQQMAHTKPHILDLYQLGNVNKSRSGIIEELIESGKAGLADLDPYLLSEEYSNGKPFFNNRPYYQLTANEEIIHDDLFLELGQLKHPIQFIDFEATRMAIPYHKNMQPYELVAFQWSCHKLLAGGEIVHEQFINTEQPFPNFTFAETLKRSLDLNGSILIWSSYEITVLKAIYDQLETAGEAHNELGQWLAHIAKIDETDKHQFVDMEKLARLYYFHPATKAKTSIKSVLPSVLGMLTDDVAIDSLRNFELADGRVFSLYRPTDSGIISPYKLLPDEKVNELYAVNEGTGAIRAYQDMLYGPASKDPIKRQALRNALLNYCKLDTLAMLVIYRYWLEKA